MYISINAQKCMFNKNNRSFFPHGGLNGRVTKKSAESYHLVKRSALNKTGVFLNIYITLKKTKNPPYINIFFLNQKVMYITNK